MYERLGIEHTSQLIAYVYERDRTKKEIAAIASCLTKELIDTDDAAQEITQNTVKEQIHLVEAVLRAMGVSKEPVPLFLEGGLILKNQEINRRFQKLLKDRRLPVYLAEKEKDAAFGAASFVV